jgi:hypothetical protein
MINSGYGSTTDAMHPQEVWGPFTSEKQAEDLSDKIDKWLEELDMDEYLCQILELDDGELPPSSRQDLADILGLDDDDEDEDD